MESLTLMRPQPTEADGVLTPEALEFVQALVQRFGPERRALLTRRAERWQAYAHGERPAFLAETADIRAGDWRVQPAPADLQDRRVEITGPAERKMIINALNSGANVFMADLEDALSPTWGNVVRAQADLMAAVRGTLQFDAPDGKAYRLQEKRATLIVRPRGWHLTEKNVSLDGGPIPASFFDFGLFFYHNARELVARGSGPYFYLPKLEDHHEAELWSEVLAFSEDTFGLPRGTARVTVLIETIGAAFEMDEILYALRDHACGLNAGRWDYIFSICKKLRHDPAFIFPDRVQVTMAAPFMRAYTDLLVKTCHRRGAHAIGGMAAFVPSRKEPEVTAQALEKVATDKRREASQGFDGTWVAHPDLVPVARAAFDAVLGDRPNQLEVDRANVVADAHALLDVRVPGGAITEAGVRNNVNVALAYIAAWLAGQGAVALHHLMEDAATAEIARAQLWQWIRHEARMDDGRTVTRALYREARDQELASLTADGPGTFPTAVRLLDGLVLSDAFIEFLTLPAYMALEADLASSTHS